MTGVSSPPTMSSVGAFTFGNAAPARSGRPPRDTTAPTRSGTSAAATSAAPPPVEAPNRPTASRLVAGWQKAGGEIELQIYPGANHGFMTGKPNAPYAGQAIDRMKAFIREHTG